MEGTDVIQANHDRCGCSVFGWIRSVSLDDHGAAVKELIGYALFLALGILVLIGVCGIMHPLDLRHPEMTMEEKRFTEARFQYHGIELCECDRSGCFFWRDGQRCRL